MQSLSTRLNEIIEKYHVLKHPFYQAWNEGKLSQECLRFYAQQYLHHVKAFPRYISSTHAQTESLEARQILLENLIDEEKGPENHPELWMRFAERLGSTRDEAENVRILPETQALIDCFMGQARASAEEGMASLYAYESQIPAVAETKIRGLKAFYGINDKAGLGFFEVHKTADEYHSAAVAKILDSYPPEVAEKAEKACERSAQALWNFLSGICHEMRIKCQAA